MKIGLIDADLLDNGTRHPNLALMKISAFMKERGHDIELLFDYNVIDSYDKIYLSRVFTFTNIPVDVDSYKNIEYGGTGFYPENAPDLPYEIEHHMPDYTLYNRFIQKEIDRGIKPIRYSDYLDYSIGFATRGCFRKCDFCVNKKFDRVFQHAKVTEFFDPAKKYIYLWDDNILGYEKWNEVFDELADIGRPFQFRQGIDIRLMTKEKAKVLANAKYRGDYIFAFDYLKDRELIEKNIRLWREYSSKTTKLYLLCAYESQDINDIISVFERIRILMKYKCLGYIMRYQDYDKSEMRGMYINLARWCNQPDFFKKKSFRQYCEANGKSSSTYKYMVEFEKKYPEVAKKYFDLRFDADYTASEQDLLMVL